MGGRSGEGPNIQNQLRQSTRWLSSNDLLEHSRIERLKLKEREKAAREKTMNACSRQTAWAERNPVIPVDGRCRLSIVLIRKLGMWRKMCRIRCVRTGQGYVNYEAPGMWSQNSKLFSRTVSFVGGLSAETERPKRARWFLGKSSSFYCSNRFRIKA